MHDDLTRRPNSPKGRAWPMSEGERQAELKRRWSSYTGEPYSADDVTSMSLFQYRDTGDNIAISARRICADIAYVAEVDAAAIATTGLSLQVPDEAQESSLEAGREIWRRSNVADRLPMWALQLCIYGEGLIEAVKHPTLGGILVWHPAPNFQVEWDEYGLSIKRAIISYTLPPTVSMEGGRPVASGAGVAYVRVLSADRVDVYRDGVLDNDASGTNPLGIVAAARVAYRDLRTGLVSAWAGTHYEDQIASLDSMITQMQALGARHANPILKAMGTSVGPDADLQTVGRVIELHPGTDLQWLEANLQAIQALVNQSSQLQDAMRATLPEFLFTESGANSSGTALSYRASAFVAKIRPIREGMYAALATATAMARRIDDGGAWTAADAVYLVDGGDPLPMDEAARAQLVVSVMDAGLLRRVDAVRSLQAAGIIPDGDPVDYANAAVGEAKAMQSATEDALRSLLRLRDALDEVAAGNELPDAGGGEEPGEVAVSPDDAQPADPGDDTPSENPPQP